VYGAAAVLGIFIWVDQLKAKQIFGRLTEANNVGLFYKHINSRIAYRKSIGTLVGDNGNAVTLDQRKADMFNNYYAKAGITDNGCTHVCDTVSVSSLLETDSLRLTLLLPLTNSSQICLQGLMGCLHCFLRN